MQSITTIGLDIAKSVFQVHGVDASGQVLIRRQLKFRFPGSRPCPWRIRKFPQKRIGAGGLCEFTSTSCNHQCR
jgi:hypothetical protein